MSRDLAREIGRAQRAEARHRRIVSETKQARRAQRLEKRAAARPWWRRAGGPAAEPPQLSAAPAPRPEDVTSALAVSLGAIAERIAEHGTHEERQALQALHDATRWTAPGAAAALVDWDGAETARLRAFGVLHGVVLGVLGDDDRAWLLDRLRGGTGDVQGHRVA